jgi:hypothetical protein
VLKQREIWNFFFKTHLKCFHRTLMLTVTRSITWSETDGVSIINPVCARASLADGQETKTAATEAEHRQLPDYTNISSKVGGDQSNMSDLLYRG